MFKLLSHLCILIIGINHASATSCHELHQSQLISLNERMNQMLDTISSLLPKPLKKPKTSEPLTSTPPVDYFESSPSNETPYTPPIYTPVPQARQIMYIPPSYSPVPAAVIPPSPLQPNSIPLLPSYYSPMGTGLPVDYAYPSTSNLTPGFSRSPHPYEIMPNPMPVSNPYPSSYPPISHIQRYPTPPVDYNRPSPPEYPLPAPVYPYMPPFSPVPPPYPVQVYTMQPPRYP